MKSTFDLLRLTNRHAVSLSIVTRDGSRFLIFFSFFLSECTSFSTHSIIFFITRDRDAKTVHTEGRQDERKHRVLS